MENQNQVQVQNRKSMTSIWGILLKRWFVVVITFVLFFAGATAYSVVKVKPVYTASTSIVLKMAITDDVNASNNTNNATLAKRNLPTVKECLQSQKCVDLANQYYNEEYSGSISKGSIQVTYGESSMIFTLGYADANADTAKRKLDAVIKSAVEILPSEIEAESVGLVPVQNNYNVEVSDSKSTTIMLGAVIGLVVGMALVLLIYVLDNKVREPADVEGIMEASVLAYISDYDATK